MSQTVTKPQSTRAEANPNFVPGPIRAKRCPPTLTEAVEAARDIADSVEGQIEVAASLMGMDRDAVRAEVERVAAEARSAEEKVKSGAQVLVKDRAGAARTVVVQRTGRMSRSAAANAGAAGNRTGAVVVERKRYTGLGTTPRPGTIRTFDLTRRSSREG